MTRALWGDGTWSSFSPRSPPYQANGHSWPSDPFLSSEKKPSHPCSLTLSSHPLWPFVAINPHFWLPSSRSLGDTDTEGAPCLCPVRTRRDLYAFSHAPGHTTEHTLPNRLAHPSTPVNEHVHSPPGLCVPYTCVCIAEGVPCVLGWSVWSRPASWHTQTSKPALMLAVGRPNAREKPACVLLLMCFSCLPHPRNLGFFFVSYKSLRVGAFQLLAGEVGFYLPSPLSRM